MMGGSYSYEEYVDLRGSLKETTYLYSVKEWSFLTIESKNYIMATMIKMRSAQLDEIAHDYGEVW